MNLLKPCLSIFLASIILFVSCSQYDNIQKFDDTSLNIAKYQLENFNLTVNKRSGNNFMNHQLMNYFENQNNVNLDFSEILYELNEKMTDEKFEITLQSGILNQEDLNLIKDLKQKLQNDDFTNVISDFEENVLNLNLSNEKFKIYNTFVNSLKLTNNLDPSLFQSNDYSSRDGDLVDCVLATIAFVVAVVALVGIEVASFGIATAAAVIGYIAASAAWVRACK